MKFPIGILILALAASTNVSQAASYTWSGASGTDFSTGGNWVGGTEPSDSTTADIGVFGSTIAANQPTLGGDYKVNGLEFQRTTGGWTLGGVPSTVLTLGSNGINDSANTSGTTTIDTSIRLGGAAGSSTFSVGAGGTLDINGSLIIDSGPSGDTTINGGTMVVSKLDAVTAGTVRGFNKFGTGTLVIEGAAGSNYQGPFEFRAGRVIIGHKDALGYGTGLISGGAGTSTLEASTDLTGVNAISKNWQQKNGTIVISGSHSIELSGTLTATAGTPKFTNNLDAGKTFIVSGSGSGVSGRDLSFDGSGLTEIRGDLSGPGAFKFLPSATGVVLLSGSNSYAGATAIGGGGLVQFTKRNALYAGTTASWTNANINVSSGTLGLSVGGVDEFSTSDVSTLLTNLTTGIVNNGLRANAAIAFDTTNASGGVFTIADNIVNSTGTGGGAVGVQKLGANTLELTGSNTYTGPTTVSAGTLLVSAGNINSTTTIAVDGTSSKLRYTSTTVLNRNVAVTNGGTFSHSSVGNYAGALTLTNGKLAGTNWNGNLDGLTIGANQTISPGNSPGTASTGDQTWATGGTYLWEINDATGTSGSDPGWDLLSGTGSLSITASVGNEFTIEVTSLTAGNVGGHALNFSGLTTDYKWMIADFANTIAFDASAFILDTSAFTNQVAGGSSFDLIRGDALGIGGDDTQLWIAYAVPEPGVASLFAAGLLSLTAFGRRRRWA